jgi:deoxyribodipyrimidine photolyase
MMALLLACSARLVVAQECNVKDTVFMLNGNKVNTEIKSIDMNYIYTVHNTRIAKKKIHKIRFMNGMVQEFNKKLNETDQWQEIMLTADSTEVKDLKFVEQLKVSTPVNPRKVKSATVSAKIEMRKKAAEKKADIVYVTHYEIKGGYGDIPTYEMEGMAYRYE